MTAIKLEAQTAFGTVPVWGRLESPDRPLLLVIRGLLPPADHLDWLATLFPEHDVALLHLPGMHSPYMPEPSIDRFGAAFDEVLAVLGHARVAVLGMSMGGLAAMAMRSRALRAILLVDSPLSTTSLWSLHEHFVIHARDDIHLQDWLFRIAGIVPAGIVNRDYRPLLSALHTPVGLLAGDRRPGPPGTPASRPSLVSETDLAAYRACSWDRCWKPPTPGMTWRSMRLSTSCGRCAVFAPS